MNKRVYRQDMAAGVVLVLIGIAAFLLAIGMPGKAPLFPKIVSTGIAVLGILLILTSLSKINKDSETQAVPAEAKDFVFPLITLILLLIYVMAVITVGFYIATPIMLVGYMYLMGIRKVKPILVTTVIIMLFVYCLFTLQLNVPLPAGILG